MIDIYYIKCDDCETNVGDMIGPYILKKISNKEIRQVGPSTNPLNPSLMMVGSIASDSKAGCILAGVGILTTKHFICDFKECWGLRGKFTLKNIKKNIDLNSIVFGDPGLIMPCFYPSYPIKSIKKKYKYGLILHYVDIIDKLNLLININDDVLVISVYLDLEKFIDNILLCEKIISSSLHGIVLSNAYNIPVCWIRFSNSRLPNDDIKFYDYFSALEHIISNNISCLNIKDKINLNDINDNQYIKIIDEFNITKKQYEIYGYLYTNINKTYNIQNKNIIYGYERTNEIFLDIINKNNNYFINRIGGLEFDIYNAYMNVKNISKINKDYVDNLKKYAGYYDINNSDEILKKFIDLYMNSYNMSDIIMVGNSELRCKIKYLLPTNYYYLKQNTSSNLNLNLLLGDKCIMNFDYIENFRYLHEWFPLLNNKRILIISPFKNDIIEQYKIKDKLFTTRNELVPNFKYPEFSDIIFIDSPLTLDNFSQPHNNWFETYSHLCCQIDLIIDKFDVALLMCGCYASPLGAYIKQKGRSAIYLGGIGQLLFGIRGSRYEIPYYTNCMNDNWKFSHLKSIIKTSQNYHNSEGLKAYF